MCGLIINLITLHYLLSFLLEAAINSVPLQCQSSLVIRQSREAALSVSTSCGKDTTDLLLITNEAQWG